MSRSIFYNRVGYVVITDSRGWQHKYGAESGDKVESNLDFKFNIRKTEGSDTKQQHVTVDLLGLSTETINKLLYWGPRDQSTNMLKTIEVYAGYEDVGAELLFKGYIFNASVSPLPDRWVHLLCDNLPMTSEVWNCNYKNASFKAVCQGCALQFNLNLDWDESIKESDLYVGITLGKDGKLHDHQFVCAGIQLNEALNRLDEWCDDKTVVYVEGDSLVVRRIDKEQEPKKLSVDTGLLNVDNVGFQTSEGLCIKVTARLDTIWKLGKEIQIESKLNPTVNGTWHIYEINYVGHFRGNEWFVKMTGYATEQTMKQNSKQNFSVW